MRLEPHELARRFRDAAARAFPGRLRFGFICGSVAAGSGTARSDIDMLICLKRRDRRSERSFLRWYFAIHRRAGMTPDRRWKFECVGSPALARALDHLRTAAVPAGIWDASSADALVWACMLLDPRIGFVGNRHACMDFTETARRALQHWRTKVLARLREFPANRLSRELSVLCRTVPESLR